jgi:hypothetical protein
MIAKKKNCTTFSRTSYLSPALKQLLPLYCVKRHPTSTQATAFPLTYRTQIQYKTRLNISSIAFLLCIAAYAVISEEGKVMSLSFPLHDLNC